MTRGLANNQQSMNKYRGKIRGMFEKTQDVYADSLDEAKKKLEGNEGEDIEDTAISIPDILEVEQLD